MIRSPYTLRTVRIGTHFGHEEEGGCLHCGEPLFEGDPAVMIVNPAHNDTIVNFAYCSRSCARRGEEALLERLAALD